LCQPVAMLWEGRKADKCAATRVCTVDGVCGCHPPATCWPKLPWLMVEHGRWILEWVDSGICTVLPRACKHGGSVAQHSSHHRLQALTGMQFQASRHSITGYGYTTSCGATPVRREWREWVRATGFGRTRPGPSLAHCLAHRLAHRLAHGILLFRHVGHLVVET